MTSGPPHAEPPGFDWPVYADATFAGLAILIPIPLVDMLIEALFCRRMPARIAACRRRSLDPGTIRDLNRKPLSLLGCLFLPVWLVLVFLKRLFRTILYFLTVKDATDALSRYWHRAFLIDYSLARGHLDHREQSALAVQAIGSVLEEVTTSPLNKLAGQVVGGVKRKLFSHPLRRGVEGEVAQAARERIGGQWGDLRVYFDDVAARYDGRFAQLLATQAAGD